MTHEEFSSICESRRPTPDEVASWAKQFYTERLNEAESDEDVKDVLASICFGVSFVGPDRILAGLVGVNTKPEARLAFIGILSGT